MTNTFDKTNNTRIRIARRINNRNKTRPAQRISSAERKANGNRKRINNREQKANISNKMIKSA